MGAEDICYFCFCPLCEHQEKKGLVLLTLEKGLNCLSTTINPNLQTIEKPSLVCPNCGEMLNLERSKFSQVPALDQELFLFQKTIEKLRMDRK